MAVTITVSFEGRLMGGLKAVAGEIVFDSSYPTGGETVDLSDYLKSAGSPVVLVGASGGYVASHDGGTAAAGKVLMYRSAGSAAAMAQVPDTTDLSAVTVPFVAVGQAY